MCWEASLTVICLHGYNQPLQFWISHKQTYCFDIQVVGGLEHKQSRLATVVETSHLASNAILWPYCKLNDIDTKTGTNCMQ